MGVFCEKSKILGRMYVKLPRTTTVGWTPVNSRLSRMKEDGSKDRQQAAHSQVQGALDGTLRVTDLFSA